MNKSTNLEGLSKQEEKLEKSRANVIKIIQTRFKQGLKWLALSIKPTTVYG